jgi:hypothetical protein
MEYGGCLMMKESFFPLNGFVRTRYIEWIYVLFAILFFARIATNCC